jgi:hypothetical protein
MKSGGRVTIRANIVVGLLDEELIGSEFGALHCAQLSQGGAIGSRNGQFWGIDIWRFDAEDRVWFCSYKDDMHNLGVDVILYFLIVSFWNDPISYYGETVDPNL